MRPAAIAGAAILLAPQTGFLLGVPALDGAAVLVALTLVPGVIAVAAPAADPASSGALTERLWPALAASAGVLLLIVQPSLADWRTDLALALMPLLTGIGAVFFTRKSTPVEGDVPVGVRSPGRVTALACLLAATILGLTCLLFAHQTEPLLGGLAPKPWIAAVCLQACFAWLTLAVLGRAGAERWSAQFTLLPLVLLAQGPLMLGVQPGVRGWLGLLLVLLASLRLLFPSEAIH